MPTFSYMARDNAGAALTGEVAARSPSDAIQLLRGEGKFVVKLNELRGSLGSASASPKLAGSRGVKQGEVIYFINQLAGMIDTGVSITEALEATIDGSPPGAFRRTVQDLIQRIQSGEDFSSALAAHPKAFPALMVHMTRASEASGTLGTMLTRVADYLVDQREIKKKIKGALTYPLFMLIFCIGATIFLLSYVLPKFAAIYAGKQAILPLPTRILMAVGDWMQTNWLYVVGGTLFSIVGVILFLRSARGIYTADWLRLHTPLIGKMFRKACLARSLRSLGTMVSAGVSVLDAVLITRDVVGNRLFGRVFEEAHHRLERGDQLSESIADTPYFPRPVWQMLHAGERSGQLGSSMQRVADFCESDLRHTIRLLTQFIEPAMIMVMGVIIGGIALAMLLPIFQISKIMMH